uniref:Small ribosomal subunit protein bS18c n=3 Tax=Sargassum TaxID=3015 RepID=A0A8K1RQ93_9PHAE|nr:ribosomal protein S18 [Sargassum siliquastrum]YP_010471242.1 30S ribosomal protein S18 [Sargassum confusum]YP_010485351.1 30S ribosomal protein S18 [Sargassum macrocarpum]YP_010485490.1 30S ribosomal protein S18 [Sargassum serratifolium]QXI87524.1 ribosomal protein S18 [Sargassum muticum]UEP18018.1 ribosomal protein S18 [Sargassum kjellmanianum]AZJ16019.1 30S ribosomal protein S18 [Sargassum confusum]URP30899.1 ribosomal protein S18 [Sargassum siliquastrum]UVF63200.1 30S ribosomal protei
MLNNLSSKTKRNNYKLKPNEKIDYKQVDILVSFLTEHGKIKSRRSTELTLKQQRQLSRAIKTARSLNLLPFVTSLED